MALSSTAPSAAYHESFHLAAGACLGIPIVGVVRRKDGSGHVTTNFTVDRANSIKSGIDAAIFQMAPFVGGCEGVGKDLRKLARLEQLGIPLDVARVRCAQLLVTQRFDDLRWAFFDASMRKPTMNEADIRAVLEAACTT